MPLYEEVVGRCSLCSGKVVRTSPGDTCKDCGAVRVIGRGVLPMRPAAVDASADGRSTADLSRIVRIPDDFIDRVLVLAGRRSEDLPSDPVRRHPRHDLIRLAMRLGLDRMEADAAAGQPSSVSLASP